VIGTDAGVGAMVTNAPTSSSNDMVVAWPITDSGTAMS
jgi:hypothetical protein